MAINLTPVAKQTRRPWTPMDKIHADVKQAAEEALEYCAAHPNERLTASLGSEEKAIDFLHDLKSYAGQRDPQLVVDGNPTKAGNVRFTVALKSSSET